MRKILLFCWLPAVLIAVPAADASTSDPYFGQQWSLEKVQAEKAWAMSAGRSVVVAVIDTGVDFNHADLKNKGAGTYNCLEGSCKKRITSFNGYHGTHVAGIVGAETGNGIGVASVAPEARILSLQVCVDRTCDGDAVADAILFAADNARTMNIGVINLSLGDELGFATDSTYGPEIKAAWDAGIVVVAASGNQQALISSYGGPFAPFVMVVGATGPNDEKAAYSGGTEAELDVDMYAPGGNATKCSDSTCVVSTVPGGYAALKGTSMAAPHVAGAAALLRCQGHSQQSTVDVLKSTADQTSSGLSRVNAAKAVTAKVGGGCGASYPGTGVASSSEETTPPGKKTGSNPPNSPRPGGSQAEPSKSKPTEEQQGSVTPSSSPLATEEKEPPGLSSKALLNLGLGAALVTGALGWYLWFRRRRPAVADDE